MWLKWKTRECPAIVGLFLVGVLWRKSEEGFPNGQRPGLRLGVDQDHAGVHVCTCQKSSVKPSYVCLSEIHKGILSKRQFRGRDILCKHASKNNWNIQVWNFWISFFFVFHLTSLGCTNKFKVNWHGEKCKWTVSNSFLQNYKILFIFIEELFNWIFWPD